MPGFIWKILVLSVFFTLGGCEPEAPDDDPCLATMLPQVKEYEIKLAVRVVENNPLLTGGAAGSQKPSEFADLVVDGTIKKAECGGDKSEPVLIGNSYITRATDPVAQIGIPESYWIGHVVYVYDFDNTKDQLDLDLSVRITMNDGKSYTCKVSDETSYQQILLVPGQLYYYVLVDIYSDSWSRV